MLLFIHQFFQAMHLCLVVEFCLEISMLLYNQSFLGLDVCRTYQLFSSLQNLCCCIVVQDNCQCCLTLLLPCFFKDQKLSQQLFFIFNISTPLSSSIFLPIGVFFHLPKRQQILLTLYLLLLVLLLWKIFLFVE